MVRRDIDGASLAPDRERRLHFDFPTVRTEPLDQSLDESCVRLVEQPIQPLTVPAHPNLKLGVKGLADPSELPERDGPESPTFDP